MSSLDAAFLVPSSSLTLPSSSMWKRRFSKSSTSPSLREATAASTSGPTQSDALATGLPKSFAKALATGAKRRLSTTLPSGRPRWEARITRAPLPIRYWMVGRAATRRLSSSTTPSLRGTLKSSRTKTRFPATLRSSTNSLAMEFLAKVMKDDGTCPDGENRRRRSEKYIMPRTGVKHSHCPERRAFKSRMSSRVFLDWRLASRAPHDHWMAVREDGSRRVTPVAATLPFCSPRAAGLAASSGPRNTLMLSDSVHPSCPHWARSARPSDAVRLPVDNSTVTAESTTWLYQANPRESAGGRGEERRRSAAVRRACTALHHDRARPCPDWSPIPIPSPLVRASLICLL